MSFEKREKEIENAYLGYWATTCFLYVGLRVHTLGRRHGSWFRPHETYRRSSRTTLAPLPSPPLPMEPPQESTAGGRKRRRRGGVRNRRKNSSSSQQASAAALSPSSPLAKRQCKVVAGQSAAKSKGGNTTSLLDKVVYLGSLVRACSSRECSAMGWWLRLQS
jgi:hypothetical protein